MLLFRIGVEGGYLRGEGRLRSGVSKGWGVSGGVTVSLFVFVSPEGAAARFSGLESWSVLSHQKGNEVEDQSILTFTFYSFYVIECFFIYISRVCK